jgi:acylphosphatase
MKVRVMVTIQGLVQGVSYRYFTLEKATGLNVSGWVKNLANGDVQGCFEGDEKAVQQLIDWCHEGPRLARVERVLVGRREYTGEFKGFQVR